MRLENEHLRTESSGCPVPPLSHYSPVQPTVRQGQGIRVWIRQQTLQERVRNETRKLRVR